MSWQRRLGTGNDLYWPSGQDGWPQKEKAKSPAIPLALLTTARPLPSDMDAFSFGLFCEPGRSGRSAIVLEAGPVTRVGASEALFAMPWVAHYISHVSTCTCCCSGRQE